MSIRAPSHFPLQTAPAAACGDLQAAPCAGVKGPQDQDLPVPRILTWITLSFIPLPFSQTCQTDLASRPRHGGNRLCQHLPSLTVVTPCRVQHRLVVVYCRYRPSPRWGGYRSDQGGLGHCGPPPRLAVLREVTVLLVPRRTAGDPGSRTAQHLQPANGRSLTHARGGFRPIPLGKQPGAHLGPSPRSRGAASGHTSWERPAARSGLRAQGPPTLGRGRGGRRVRVR